MRVWSEIALHVGALILWTGALFYHSDIPKSEIIEKYGSRDLQSVVVNNDTVYFAARGEGETILLLHGTSSFMQTWDAWARDLEMEYRVVRPDLPGFGLTGAPHNEDFSLENYLNTLFTLMDTLGIESFHVAGNSFGGYLATEMALHYPNRIESLCILNGSGYKLDSLASKKSGFSLASTPIIKDVMRYITPKFVVRQSLKSFYGDPDKVSEAVVQRYFDYLLCRDNRKSLVKKSTQNYPPLNGRLADISCPTLILWGEQDQLIPLAKGRAMATSIPSATLSILSQTGHIPMEEKPNESLVEYQSFLNQIPFTQ